MLLRSHSSSNHIEFTFDGDFTCYEIPFTETLSGNKFSVFFSLNINQNIFLTDIKGIVAL